MGCASVVEFGRQAVRGSTVGRSRPTNTRMPQEKAPDFMERKDDFRRAQAASRARPSAAGHLRAGPSWPPVPRSAAGAHVVGVFADPSPPSSAGEAEHRPVHR